MTKARSMRTATGVVLWLAAAAAATTVGLFAVGAIGTDIFGASAQQPLSQSEVDERLSQAPPVTTSSTPPSSSAPAPATTTPPRPPGKTISVQSVGGTVWARCAPGGVNVVGTAPEQGFQTESDDADDDDHPKITFVSGEREIEVRLRCSGGTITHTVEEKD